MTARIIAAAAGLSVLATAATAGPTYFATKGSNLYRVSDSGVETFKLDTKLNSMAFDTDGRLWGTARKDEDGDGKYELIEIVNPFGNNLGSVSHGDFISVSTGSMFFKDPSLMGFDRSNNQLVDLNAVGQSTDPMGPVLGGGDLNFGSSAYDSLNNILYGIKGDKLYQVDEDGSGYSIAELATLTGGAQGKIGGEWYNGQYYHSVNDGETFHVYTVDLSSGALTEVANWTVPGFGPNGFAVADGTIVPAPGAAALLAMGGMGLTRRRRR